MRIWFVLTLIEIQEFALRHSIHYLRKLYFKNGWLLLHLLLTFYKRLWWIKRLLGIDHLSWSLIYWRRRNLSFEGFLRRLGSSSEWVMPVSVLQNRLAVLLEFRCLFALFPNHQRILIQKTQLNSFIFTLINWVYLWLVMFYLVVIEVEFLS